MFDQFEGGGFIAGYIRVSSGNTYADVQRSVAAQKQMLEKFTEEDGSGTIVWYVDVGMTALPHPPCRPCWLMPRLPTAASTPCWFTASHG